MMASRRLGTVLLMGRNRSGLLGPGVTSCALAATLFGASTPAASVLARDVPPLVLAGLLYLGAAAGVAPWFLRIRPRREALRQGAPMIAVAIVAGGVFGPAFLVAGLVDTPASTASLLLNSELVFTVVVAATIFREHLGPRMIVAALLVAVATSLLVWQPGDPFGWRGLLIVGACVCWAIDNGATARIDQVSPHHVTFVKGAVAGSVNLVLGLVVSGAAELDVSSAVWALVVGAAGYGASITLWVRGAQQLGAARAQVIFATGPFVGAALSWALLGDTLRPVHLIATVMAAIGVGVSLGSAHGHAHRHVETVHDHRHRHDDGHHDHAGDDARAHDTAIEHSHVHRHHADLHDHAHVPDLHHQHRDG
ncbi:MAG: hypothetical protein RI958_774 [Actinomycetota bacterium]